MRHFWFLLPAILLASPVFGQNPPPEGANLVAASNQVNDAAANVPPADLQAALEAEAAQQPSSQSAADAALAALRADNEQPVAKPEKTPQTNVTVESEQPAESKSEEPIVATGNPNSNQAATDALARALAEQAQRAAEAAAFADAQQAEVKQKLRDQAFENATRNTFPLTPDQIKEVMQKFEETQYAVVPPSYGQPKGEVAVTTVSLDPGAEPPEIMVAVGYVTTVTVLDASGQPWPIQDIGVGGNFDVPQPETNSHVIRISPMSRFGYGNLSVRLKDLPTPVTFRVSAGNDIVHYRYDARIPRMGPNAKIALIQKTKIVAGDDVIMSVLDNAIPSNASKLTVSGTDKRTAAYRIGERVFVRTPLTLLSPSWDASVSSADGTTVYEVGETPVLLLSDQGQMVRAKLTDSGA
ncbi:MAG: DotH/IcmK family type IV secretion protein [Bdellovibrionales bacterium]